MASACRSLVVAITKRSFSIRPAFASPTTPFLRPSTRFAAIAMLGSLDTLLPLHSTIAAARLKSNIAVDTSCWSWLSQDLATPR